MQTGRWHRRTGLKCDVWLFCLVWYRGCRRRFESLADEHQWERTQTVSGKGVTLHLCRQFAFFPLFIFCQALLSVLVLPCCHCHFCLLLPCSFITVTAANRLLCFVFWQTLQCHNKTAHDFVFVGSSSLIATAGLSTDNRYERGVGGA